MLSKIILIAVCLGMASAAVWRVTNPEKPKEFENQTGCFIKETNEVIPFGNIIRPIGRCVRITCGETMINYASCGVVITRDPNCFVTKQDLTKPHPKCCSTVECNTENEIE